MRLGERVQLLGDLPQRLGQPRQLGQSAPTGRDP
jgi:hypothetical protein